MQESQIGTDVPAEALYVGESPAKISKAPSSPTLPQTHERALPSPSQNCRTIQLTVQLMINNK